MEQQSITVELKFDRLQEAVMLAVETMLKGSYGNPIKDAVEKAMKEKGSEVELLVKQIISDSLTNPQFKEKLGEVVLQNMVTVAMKK